LEGVTYSAAGFLHAVVHHPASPPRILAALEHTRFSASDEGAWLVERPYLIL